jgi:hypothetical protein
MIMIIFISLLLWVILLVAAAMAGSPTRPATATALTPVADFFRKSRLSIIMGNVFKFTDSTAHYQTGYAIFAVDNIWTNDGTEVLPKLRDAAHR